VLPLYFEALLAQALLVGFNPFGASVLSVFHNAFVSQLLGLRTRTAYLLLGRLRRGDQRGSNWLSNILTCGVSHSGLIIMLLQKN